MREDVWIERLIAAAREAGAETSAPGVVRGPGDDAAVIDGASLDELVWTTDEQVEGVHFRRRWATWRDVGAKAIGSALSDVAGMGAEPVGVLLALRLPEDALGEELMAGAGAKLAECGCPLLGGNVTPSPRAGVTVSALGRAPRGGSLLRESGKAGDVLFVSGRLGLARLGFLALEAGRDRGDPLFGAAFEAQLDPRPRLALGRALPRGVGCMDLSDGLAVDLPRLAKASNVAAVVTRDALPTPAPEACAALGEDPADLAWRGGEDYELLVAGAPELEALGLIPIGRLVAGEPGSVELR